jgi:hypothetical protein
LKKEKIWYHFEAAVLAKTVQAAWPAQQHIQPTLARCLGWLSIW